ncbi:conserved hypothetical protein [Ricinus communis]|uniref:Myb/SANT-like domain-containing protein n=1 Tax=Ricinus communis TaxID=3988 RepID=B9RRN8_RICCO|nr:conserved hypothetical protein [Ricinus communis]
MDNLLLDLLKEEKAKWDKDKKQFNKKAWEHVVVILNVEFRKIRKTSNKRKTVSGLKTIQKLMNCAIEILDKKSGFGWNNIKKLRLYQVFRKVPYRLRLSIVWCWIKSFISYRTLMSYFKKIEQMEVVLKLRRKNIIGSEQNRISIDEMQMNDEGLLEQPDPSAQFFLESPTHDSFSSASRQSKLPSKGGGQKRRITFDVIANELMDVTSSMKEIARAIITSSQRIFTVSEITVMVLLTF